MTDIYFFKVKDYTTILLGQRSHDGFYVERGDGTKYNYEDYRIDWYYELEIPEKLQEQLNEKRLKGKE